MGRTVDKVTLEIRGVTVEHRVISPTRSETTIKLHRGAVLPGRIKNRLKEFIIKSGVDRKSLHLYFIVKALEDIEPHRYFFEPPSKRMDVLIDVKERVVSSKVGGNAWERVYTVVHKPPTVVTITGRYSSKGRGMAPNVSIETKWFDYLFDGVTEAFLNHSKADVTVIMLDDDKVRYADEFLIRYGNAIAVNVHGWKDVKRAMNTLKKVAGLLRDRDTFYFFYNYVEYPKKGQIPIGVATLNKESFKKRALDTQSDEVRRLVLKLFIEDGGIDPREIVKSVSKVKGLNNMMVV